MRPRWFVILLAALAVAGAAIVGLQQPPPPASAVPPAVQIQPTHLPRTEPVATPATNSSAAQPPAPSPVVAGFMARAREAQTALSASQLTNAPRPMPPGSPKPADMPLSRTADGAWLVEQLYVVRGAGTTNDPFVVSWDLLLSAAETYAPAGGSWELPPRLLWLDGKQLQIKGFLTSPTRATKSDHLLLTWSALDACCLGPPPNPCQAVEVKLESPLTLERHVLIGVTVEGTFKLEPRLAGGLGMSLFRLGNARIVAVGGR